MLLAVNGDVGQLVALIRRRGDGDERPGAAVRRVDADSAVRRLRHGDAVRRGDVYLTPHGGEGRVGGDVFNHRACLICRVAVAPTDKVVAGLARRFGELKAVAVMNACFVATRFHISPYVQLCCYVSMPTTVDGEQLLPHSRKCRVGGDRSRCSPGSVRLIAVAPTDKCSMQNLLGASGSLKTGSLGST